MTRRAGLTFALSEDYARATGGFVYDQRLATELERLGWRVERLLLPAGFPRPSPAARQACARLLAGLADHTVLVTDQLCLGVMPEVAAAEARRLRLVMIVHHPLAMEGYERAAGSRMLFGSEREALRHVSLAIVSSEATARALRVGYGVEPGRLLVAPPGTDLLPSTEGAGVAPLQLLCVGALVPRKGHDLLAAALALLVDLPWQLTAAGNLDRAPDHVAALRVQLVTNGLAERVKLAGEVPADAIEGLWHRADIFVSASRHEGYGMAIAEAVARGLPVVATHAGVVGDWLGTSAASIVATGDVVALASALRRVLTEPEHRLALREGAIAWRRRLPSWRVTGEAVHRRLCALAA